MREHAEEPPIPRLLLRAVLGLIIFSIVAVLLGQYTGRGLVLTTPAEPVAERAVRFDVPDGGGLVIHDAETGGLIAELAPGADGFISGVLRAMERGRTVNRVEGPDVYTLTRHADGQLSITDPLTGDALELNSFGRDNLAAFARLLTSEEARP
jgi:putative photosynthetic complex assembly protein